MDDPVLVQRARVNRIARAGRRVGGLLYLVAVVAFVAGYVAGFTPAWVNAVVIPLVVGSVVLGPSIIVGYMVKAADRDDREAGRPTLG